MAVLLLGCRLLWVVALASVCACGPASAQHWHVATSVSGLVERWLSEQERDAQQRVVVHRGASSTLRRQILAGAPAHVFLSADARSLHDLPVLDRHAVLATHLVLLAHPGQSLADLAAAQSLVLGAPGVPLGEYARTLLAARGLPEPPRVVHGKDAHDVLAKLRAGAAQAALVYATDVALAPELRVVQRFPAPDGPAVRYEAALLDESARARFEALREPAFTQLAEQLGFDPGAPD
ncbi:MAG: hypothetical protein DHS20C15_04910 [Planctomycetota bacterium]|nr:MAG: hypothetical protein DHS20C15_04910 [Planctomycetota bacterium]